MTANQTLFDATLRHQVALRRYGDTTLRRIARLLEQADRDLAERIRKRLDNLGTLSATRTQRLEELLREVQQLRAVVHKELRSEARAELRELAGVEAEWERQVLIASIPVQVNLDLPSAEQLRAVVHSRPFQGRFLREWFRSLEQSERRGLRDALRMGVTNGESTDDIVRRVVGTRANNYSDGVMSVSRRNATTVMRTATTHVSNAARAEVWSANRGVVKALRWTATLDGRTSAVCRSRDGALTPLGDEPLPKGTDLLRPPDARPPAHMNCRSVMVAVIDPDVVTGERPTVTDTRNRRVREIDFRAEAKAEDPSRWRQMTVKQRNQRIAELRKEWSDANIGQVPAKTNYQSWLTRQSERFQDEVLGPTRGKLFRDGGLTLDNFVDATGRELTLTELARRYPDAFEMGGL